jgi:hypothetical protein
VGAKNGIDVIVDHISATEVAPRGAAEAAAGKGHDLFHFLSPPAAFERQSIDHADVVAEVEKRHGKMIPLAHKSTFNPATGRSFAFSDSYVPDPGNYRIDLWSQVGFANGPDTWEDLRVGGRKIKERFGNPVGISFSQEMDSKAQPPGKYTVLATALDWSTNVGFPGYATAAVDEVFNTFVIPTMFARVARDEISPEDAVRVAQSQITRIVERRGSATPG